MTNLHNLSAYQFDLPPELIAQQPCAKRDESRLLLIDRKKGTMQETVFRELPNILGPNDGLVLNDTKVLPARLKGKRPTGGSVELLLLRPRDNGHWEAMARPGRKLKPSSRVNLAKDVYVEIEESLENGNKLVSIHSPLPLEETLHLHGEMPLPHYIARPERKPEDLERYQTVFAANPGAVAAPTAGLHFTDDLLQTLTNKGVPQTRITLHVGAGTFRPVQAEDIREHKMHSEWYQISDAAAQSLNSGRRQICVGTTCCRTLESAATPEGIIQPGEGDSQLFCYPGYEFKYVEGLLTNFHLPGSSLLMLVSAFAGYELMMEAYKKAVQDRFRFFSYGDAMLIL